MLNLPLQSSTSGWIGVWVGKYIRLLLSPLSAILKAFSRLYITDVGQERGSRKKVVILGGGVAGTSVAKALDRKFDVTVVERQNHMTHLIGILRSVANKTFAPLTLIPYNRMLRDGVVVQGEVTSFSETEVSFISAAGEQVSLQYDFLVLATGANWSFPCKPNSPNALEAIKELEECADDVANGSSVVIIGGGSVGLELACEIKFHHPQKKVTLMHSGPQLVGPGFTDRFHKQLTEKVHRLGVDVLLNERVRIPPELSGRKYYAGPPLAVRTESGREAVGDVVFRCTGTSAQRGHLGLLEARGCLDRQGRVMVNDHLQVQGLLRVFAVGDCCNTPEQKLAYLAGRHAEVAAANIAALGRGAAAPPSKYAPHKGVRAGIPIGADDGVGEVQGSGLPSFLVVMFKSRDLMAARAWKELGHGGVGAGPPGAAPLSAAHRASPATARAYGLR